MNNYEPRIKLLIIGDQNVGKTSIIYQYVKKEFSPNVLGTNGIDYLLKEELIDEKKVKLQIWDTAGQERYRSITASFYRNAQGIILAFDLSNLESFEKLKLWINSLKIHLGEQSVNMIVFGNKSDLERAVNKNIVDNFIKESKIEYFEGSAKDNINISESFVCLIKKIVAESEIPKKNSFPLQPTNLRKKNKCCH